VHIHHTNFLLLDHFPATADCSWRIIGACHVVSKRNSEKKLILLGREMNLIEQYGLIALISFPLFYLAGAGAAVFWVLGASVFFIVAHAIFFGGELLRDESFGLPVQSI